MTSFLAVLVTVTLRMSSLGFPTSPEASAKAAGLVTSACAGDGDRTVAGASRAGAGMGVSRFTQRMMHGRVSRGEERSVPGESRSGVGHAHHVGDRQRLAAQPDAVGEVLVVENVVVEHLDLALEQPDR